MLPQFVRIVNFVNVHSMMLLMFALSSLWFVVKEFYEFGFQRLYWQKYMYKATLYNIRSIFNRIKLAGTLRN